MYSIYHFFQDIFNKKGYFLAVNKLEDFPYNTNLLSCKNKAKFPDIAIKININKQIFTGGELIEFKDSRSYNIASFNSTIPTGKKKISKILRGRSHRIKEQMEEAGDDIYSLLVRDVFYLVRGKRQKNIKVCLLHGSFFETLRVEQLIQQAFAQVLEERLQETGENIPKEVKTKILDMFSEQDSFRKVRDVSKASVKIRFRIMTEAKPEGNILNSEQYPQILDNTLNLVLPYGNKNDENKVLEKMNLVFGNRQLKKFTIFKIKHHFNGDFIVFQTVLI